MSERLRLWLGASCAAAAVACGTVTASPDAGSGANGNGSADADGAGDAEPGGDGGVDPDSAPIVCDDGWTGPGCDVCLVHVDQAEGQDGLDARRWATAVATVQAGIQVAQARQISEGADDCEVWVRAGVYLAGTGRTDSFVMAPGVHLYGGFAGDEGQRSERDWEQHETILSGDLQQNDNPDDDASFDDNVFTVVVGSDDATLDGFTVTGSTSDTESSGTHNGGGMVNDSASPTIANVIFYRNRAESSGGMYNTDSHPTLTNVTFLENEANRFSDGSGGGMGNYSGSSPTLVDVRFIRNTSTGRGGAMQINGSTPQLTNVTFTENRALTGGAVSIQSFNADVPTFTDVTFTDNEATNGGGAIHNRSGVAPLIVRATFTGNRATDGAAIQNDFVSPTIIDSIFINNEAGSWGGAIYSSAGVKMDIVNALFVGNSAGSQGGAIVNRQTSNSPTTVTLTNVTIFGNSAGDRGGAIYNVSGSLSVRNSILWQNSAPESPVIGSAQNTFISHSILEGGQPADVDDNNWIQSSGANPLFVEAPSNLRLLSSSPGIDTGNSQLAILEGVENDLDGNPRIVDGGSGEAVIDLGPYELQ
jgi:predicted outer membrane repeat protein